ncbi:probable receptor-like protein kinase At5g24010 [Cynara cardunculus var. scolymus]|uniref:probable receptor-like protein kinase At5g24010 n=1 Tax=Cynara cardunculus var. scolymus TaxID=59895 RepID=UPI000D6267E7|nr:probable receptor-like protein kinase At5g24010 [Cynara cardunculus var. scolymus]
MVAIKRLNSAVGQGDPEFWTEIIVLSRYKHENIVSLLGFCDESGEKILVYEYASKKSLDLYLNSDDLTWIQRLKICIGAARGLAYLHNPDGSQQRVLHRDIKSSNILLDENWNARISDLGLSTFGPANQQITFLVTDAVGTFGYGDPVYFKEGVLTKESDVYSFGVMLFEVLCGRLCIRNNNDKHQPLARQCYEQNKVKEIIFRNIKDEIKARSLKAFTAIAYQCLKEDLEERPLMTKVVRILERALEHQQQGDANSPTDYDSDDEDIVESDVSTLDGGTSRNYVKEKRLTMNMRLKKLRERVKKQQEEVEEKASCRGHGGDEECAAGISYRLGEQLDPEAAANVMEMLLEMDHTEVLHSSPQKLSKRRLQRQGRPNLFGGLVTPIIVTIIVHIKQYVVLKLDFFNEKVKQKAMTNVYGLPGVDSIAMDMKVQTLTLTGDVDQVRVESKLKKICHTEIISAYPYYNYQQQQQSYPG